MNITLILSNRKLIKWFILPNFSDWGQVGIMKVDVLFLLLETNPQYWHFGIKNLVKIQKSQSRLICTSN